MLSNLIQGHELISGNARRKTQICPHQMEPQTASSRSHKGARVLPGVGLIHLLWRLLLHGRQELSELEEGLKLTCHPPNYGHAL